MKQEEFRELPLEKKLNLLNTQGELVHSIKWLKEKISLYIINDYYVEEIRDHVTGELKSIETLMGKNYAERMQFYSMHIVPTTDDNIEAVNFRVQGKQVCVACLSCEYEWIVDANYKFNDIECPICKGGKFTIMKETTCKKCTSVYYKSEQLKRVECPYCKLK